MLICAIFCGVLSIISLIISVMSFMEKGFLFKMLISGHQSKKEKAWIRNRIIVSQPSFLLCYLLHFFSWRLIAVF